MARDRSTFHRDAAPGGVPARAVQVRVSDAGLELQFGRGFNAGDVAIVRSIPGRRYDRDRIVWLLPDTPAVVETLRTSFGPRLLLQDKSASPATRSAHGDVAPSQGGALVPNRSGAASSKASGIPQADAARVIESVQRAIRVRSYSRKTELAYVSWIRRFLQFASGDVDGSDDLHASHAHAFLVHLATDQKLAAKSRNQAASAIAFMFREALGRDEMAGIARAKGASRMPVVLSHREVLRVLGDLSGKYFLIGVLLYSAGLRLDECLRLRVKDVDFELRQILVRDGKGRKDRYVPLARRAVDLLRAQMRRVLEVHTRDVARGHGCAQLPDAMQRKDPGARRSPIWQWLFPAREVRLDDGNIGRAPLHPTAMQRQMKLAVQRSGITKRASCHTLRHSFATEALRSGCDIRTLQHVLGHRDIRTTMIYLHAVEQTGLHIRSPLDRPDDLDDIDLDQVGRPWADAGAQWELAARQWDSTTGRPRRIQPPTARPRSSRPATPDT